MTTENNEEFISDTKKITGIADKLSILLTSELQEKFGRNLCYGTLYRLLRVLTVGTIYHAGRLNNDDPLEKLGEYIKALKRYVEIISADIDSYEEAYKKRGKGNWKLH